MKASIDWKLKGSVKLEDPDTEVYAKWIFNNMTQKNIQMLQSVLKVYEHQNTWLQEGVALMFAMVVEDRKSALIKAVDAGKCDTEMLPMLNRDFHYKAVGAAMCELIHAGELDGSELMTVN